MDSSGNGSGQPVEHVEEDPHSVASYGLEGQEEISHSLSGYSLEAPQPDDRNLISDNGGLRVSPDGEVEVTSTQDHLTEAMYAEQVSRMQLNEVTRAQLGEVVRAQLNEAVYREHLDAQSVHSSHGSGPPSVGPNHNVSGPPSVQMVDNSSPETYQQPGTPMVEQTDMVTATAHVGGMHLVVATPAILTNQAPHTVGHISTVSRVSSVSHTPEMCPSPSVSQAQPLCQDTATQVGQVDHSPSPSLIHEPTQTVTQLTTVGQTYSLPAMYTDSNIAAASTTAQQYTPLPRIQDLRQPGLEHLFPATFPYNPATGTFYTTSTQYAAVPAIPAQTHFDQATYTSMHDASIAVQYDANPQYYTSSGQYTHQILTTQDVSTLASYLSPQKAETSTGMQLPLSTTQYSIATGQIGLEYTEPQADAEHGQELSGRIVSGTPEPSSSADVSAAGSPMPPVSVAATYEAPTLQVYSIRNLQDSASPSPLSIGTFTNQPTLGSQVFPPYVQEKQAQQQRLAVGTPPATGQVESPASVERMVAAAIMNRHTHGQLPVNPTETSLPVERLVADGIMKRHGHIPTASATSTTPMDRLETSLSVDRQVAEAVMKFHVPSIQPESSLPIERIVAAAIMRQHPQSPLEPEPSVPMERMVAEAMIRRNSRSPAQAQPESSTPVERLIAEAIMKRHMRSPSPMNLPDLQVHSKPDNLTQQEQPDSTVNDSHRIDTHLLSYHQNPSVLPPIATVALTRPGRVTSTHGAKLPVMPPVRTEALENEIQQPESSGHLEDGVLGGEMQSASGGQQSTSEDHLDFKEEAASDADEVVLQDVPSDGSVMDLDKMKAIQKRDEQKKKMDEKRSIRDAWFSEFPWLVVDRERKLFFCRYCKQVDNDSIFAKGRSTIKPKKDYFQKHETTEVHIGAMSELGITAVASSGSQTGDSSSQERPPANASVFPWPEQGSAGSLASMVGDLIDFAKMEMAGSTDHHGVPHDPSLVGMAMNTCQLGGPVPGTGDKASQATGEETCLIDYSNLDMVRYLKSQSTGHEKQHMALELFEEFPWLILDAVKDCLYCKACLRENKNSLLATGKPAMNMTRENLVRHEENPYHQEAMQKVGELGVGPVAPTREAALQSELNQAFKKRKRNRIDPKQLQSHNYSLRQSWKKGKDDNTDQVSDGVGLPSTPVSHHQTSTDGEAESIHKRMYFRRRIRAQWFLDFPWLELNQLEARFYCKLCRKYDQPGVFCTGKPVINPKRDNLVKHEDTEGHRIAVLQEAGMSAEDAMHSVLISEAEAKAQKEALEEAKNTDEVEGKYVTVSQQIVLEALLEFPWLELKEHEQMFFCKYCCTHNPNGLFSTGKPASNPNREEFKNHEESEGHIIALKASNVVMSNGGNLHMLSLQGKDLQVQMAPNNNFATTPVKGGSKLDWFSAFPWLRLEPDCLTVYCMPCREEKAQGELSTGKPVSSLKQEECKMHEDLAAHKGAVEQFKVKHPEIPVEASPSPPCDIPPGSGDQSPETSSSSHDSVESPWTAMFWQFACQMRHLGLLCDITLSVSSKDGTISEYRAHKLILVSGSEYFKTCLRANSILDRYHFENVTPAGLEGILDYLYGQHMQLCMKPEHYVEYYHAAKALMVPKARELVERLMILSAFQCGKAGPRTAEVTGDQVIEGEPAMIPPMETQQHIIDYERVRQEFYQGTADSSTMYDLGSRATITTPSKPETPAPEPEPEIMEEPPPEPVEKIERAPPSIPVPPKKKSLARSKLQNALLSSGPTGASKRTRGRPPKNLSEVQRRTTVGTGFNTKKKTGQKEEDKTLPDPAIPKYEYAAERKRMLSKVLPTCNICGKKFLRQSFLLRHKEIKHMRPQIKPSFECHDCDKTFSSRHDLKVHRRRHTGERPYLCTECGKAFTRKETLVEHSYTHKPDSEKPHRCEECGKGFFKIFDLRRHYIGIHSGKRPFMCHLCGKAFPWARSLRDHLAAHQADRKRPFKCDECDMTFVRKYDLTRHKVTHTKEKPFKCEWCGHGFTQKGSKDKHKREFCRNKPGGLPHPPPEGGCEVGVSEGDPTCATQREVVLPTVQQYEATMQQAMSCLLSGPVYQAGWENKPFTIPGNPM